MSLITPNVILQGAVKGNPRFGATVSISTPSEKAEEIHCWRTDELHEDFDQIRVIGRRDRGLLWLELDRFATAPGFLSREEGEVANLQIHTPRRIKRVEPMDYSFTGR